MKYKTVNPEETIKLAKKLALTLKPKNVIALIGELGAGKTCFVKGLAEGLSVPQKSYVRSPSFTLMNEYVGGRLNIYHFDFYRLHNVRETEDLGLEEYFDGDGVTIIEWADRFLECLPQNAICIKFKIIDETTREIEVI